MKISFQSWGHSVNSKGNKNVYRTENKMRTYLCMALCYKFSHVIFQNSPLKVGIGASNLEMRKLKFSVFEKKNQLYNNQLRTHVYATFPEREYRNIVTNSYRNAINKFQGGNKKYIE